MIIWLEKTRRKGREAKGPTHRVRVVTISKSKPVSFPGTVISSNGSHLAVYQEFIEPVPGNHKEVSESGHYEYTKVNSL